MGGVREWMADSWSASGKEEMKTMNMNLSKERTLGVVAAILIALAFFVLYKHVRNLQSQNARLVSALASSTAQIAESMAALRQTDQKAYQRNWNMVRVNAMEIALADVDFSELDGQGLEGVCVLLQRRRELFPENADEVGIKSIHRIIGSYFSEHQMAIQSVLEKRGYTLSPDARSCAFNPNVERLREGLKGD